MSVRKVPVYRTVMPSALTRRITETFREPFSFVMVTSASCVDHLYQALRQAGKTSVFAKQPFASIGPVTSSAVRACGGRVVVEAATSTIEGLIEAMASQAGAGRVRPERRKGHRGLP